MDINAANIGKRVIIKFGNSKYVVNLFCQKITLSSSDFSRLNINNKLNANTSLCPYLMLFLETV